MENEEVEIPRAAAVPRWRPRPNMQQRNQLFALALLSVPACVFAIVITFAVLFHYAEAHHVVGSL